VAEDIVIFVISVVDTVGIFSSSLQPNANTKNNPITNNGN
jgi:hypothetical protein